MYDEKHLREGKTPEKESAPLGCKAPPGTNPPFRALRDERGVYPALEELE